MNKHLLAAMLAIPAALSAGQAMADWRLNGTQINGLSTSGPILQGTQINGLPASGPILQGSQINGLPASGPILQGSLINGLPASGPILQGTQADGFFVHNLETRGAFFQANYLMPAPQQAPAWSALPVSRMVVHVAR